MTVNTKKVQGRRQVRYETWDDLLADAKRLSQTEVRSLGNWSPGQVYGHLARAFDASIDGFVFSVPVPMRWILTLLMKRRFLRKSIPAGFTSPPEYVPGETSAQEGVTALERAIARQQREPKRVPHPALGRIDREEWTAFHLRHAEMHMSFLVNGKDATA